MKERITAVLLGFGLMFGAAHAAVAQNAPDAYGAIAYSPRSGAYGYVYNLASRSLAEQGAHEQCAARSSTGDCKVLIWFKNACGALATASNGAYGSGWGETRALAEQYAIASCSQNAGDCRATAWVCTRR